jgi:hypothetical protein
MCNAVAGLSTCGVMFNCPRCKRPHDSQAYPTWMKDEYPDELRDDPEVKDYSIRQGEYSQENNFKRFQQLLGKDRAFLLNQKKIPDWIRDAVSSTCDEPLRSHDPDLISGEPLHLSQGYMTHLTQETAKQLADISNGGWAQRKKQDMMEKATIIAAEEKERRYIGIKKAFDQCKSRVSICQKRLDKAREKGNNQATIDSIQAELE